MSPAHDTSGATATAVEAATPAGVEFAATTPAVGRVLEPGALALIRRLHRELEPGRQSLLSARRERQAEWDAGSPPGYLDDAQSAAAGGDWRVKEIPPDLSRRRVEITGPISDPKMVINMLSRTSDGSRADAAMLDFEDSMKPTWANVVAGVQNLIGAVDGSLEFERPATAERPAKTYRLDPGDMPLLMVRCRGLHLDEANLVVDGTPVSAGLFDLALAVYHTAERLLAQGRTPKYYVPKVEHWREARWWNLLFQGLEESLGLDGGSLRATFLIETLPAAFQVEEILYELRERAAGLNVGRWDKIFSDIKCLREHADRVLADRGSISMNRPWMRAYAEHLIRVCHRHGAYAMGGMAAFTPGRTPERRQEQTRKVVEDKRFEAALGHDGCWVSHPYFIAPAMEAFESDHQLDRIPELPERPELLPHGSTPRTLDGLRTNVRVGIAYMRGWRAGLGCVAWDDLMEDLATLEISRAQVWQWRRHGVELEGAGTVTTALVERVFDQELESILGEVDSSPAEREAFASAAAEARSVYLEDAFRPFLATASEPAAEVR